MDRTLTVRLVANIGSLRAGLAAAGADVRRFGADVAGAAAASNVQTDRLARGFLVAGGVIAAALGGAVVAAAQFEKEMRNITTISGFVEKNFEQVSARLMDMSAELPQSAAELAQGLYDVASSGFAGREGLQVVETSAKAASAGLSDTATSARAITGVLNAYGLEARDSARVSDVLFQTVNLGVVTFEELAQNLGDVVAMAAATKVPIEDVGSAIATITLAGVPAAEATTSLNRVLTSFLDPSEALHDRLIELGYSSGSMAIETDGLREVMTRLRESTHGNVEEFRALFPEQRAARGALALTAVEGENWRRVADGMAESTKGVGATQKALARQQESLSYQLDILKNRVVNVGIALGTELLPILKTVSGFFGGLVDDLGNIPRPARIAVVALLGLSSAALLVGGSTLLLLSRIGRMRTELLGMGPAGLRAATAMTTLGRSIGLASGVALGALGFSMIGDSIEGTVFGVLSLVSAVGLLRQGLPAVSAGLAGLGSRLSGAGFTNAGVAVGNLATGIQTLGRRLPGIVATGAIAAATFDNIGESAAGSAIGAGALIATGAQIGAAFGAPVIGGAIGGVVALGKALFGSGESADDFKARIQSLSKEIDGLGRRASARAFLDQGKDLVEWQRQMNDEGRLEWGVVANMEKFRKEIGALARTAPAQARDVVRGLSALRDETGLTTSQITTLHGVVEEGAIVFARRSARQDKQAKENAKIRDSVKEVTQAEEALTTAQQKAAEEFQKAVDQMAEKAAGGFPGISGAFDDAARAAEHFGATLSPEVLLHEFEETLEQQLRFGQNIAAIMNAGFDDIGMIIAEKGPEAGGAIAQTLADGIRAGDPSMVAALNEKAELLGAQSTVYEQAMRDKWTPAFLRGQGAALDALSAQIRQKLGIDTPEEIAAQQEAVNTAIRGVVAGAAGEYGLAWSTQPPPPPPPLPDFTALGNVISLVDTYGTEVESIPKQGKYEQHDNIPEARQRVRDLKAEQETVAGPPESPKPWWSKYHDNVEEARQRALKLKGDIGEVAGPPEAPKPWWSKFFGDTTHLGDAIARAKIDIASLDKDVVVKLSSTWSGIADDGPGRAASGNVYRRVAPLLTGGLRISSAYRNPARNSAVGGSATSYHMDAANPALDIVGPADALNRLFLTLSGMGGWRELLWQVPGHFDHLHVAHYGGRVDASWPRTPGMGRDERLARVQVGEWITPNRAAGGTRVTIGATTLVVNGDVVGVADLERRFSRMADQRDRAANIALTRSRSTV